VSHPQRPGGTSAADSPGEVGIVLLGKRPPPRHTRAMSRRTALALAACLLLPACSDDPEPTAAQSSPAPATSAPSASPAAGPSSPSSPSSPAQQEPPFPADTAPDVEEPTGGPLTVTAVRVARQDGYDRVVFELAGEQAGEPGWRVQYDDDPRRDGSGDPVEVAGEATLVVYVDGAGYPTDTGQQEARSARVPADAEVVREVQLGSVFEGTYEAFIGTTRKAPFRVFRLADPARVVVDVRHA
jgi:hypothetical protein